MVGCTDPLSARNVASDVGYLSTSSLPLGLVRGPRAVTRPRHFQRPYNRPASPVSPPNRLTSPLFPIEPTKTRLQCVNISVVSLIPKKSWLLRVLNADLDFSIPVTMMLVHEECRITCDHRHSLWYPAGSSDCRGLSRSAIQQRPVHDFVPMATGGTRNRA